MSETPKNPEIEKEAVFKSWLTPVQGGGRTQYLFSKTAMPPGAGDIFNRYNDRRLNKGIDNPDAIKAAKAFRDITGYEAEDFLAFMFKLNGMELY